MRRREFITLVGGAAAWPLKAVAQSTKVYRVAFVSPANPLSLMTETGAPYYRALLQELRRLGYVEGQNLVVDRYSGKGQPDTFAGMARDVVQAKPDLIFAQTLRLVEHLSKATRNIPIVCYVSDPVTVGLVSSLARPGGNITGIVSDAGLEIQGKYLELLREAARPARVGWLAPRALWDHPIGAATRTAAQQIGVTLVGVLLNKFQELDYQRSFNVAKEENIDALLVGHTAEHYANRTVIISLVDQIKLPCLFPDRSFIGTGGLMSYGFNLPRLYVQFAGYIDKILKGANPGEMPMEQPTTFELIINLKAAKALGLTIPEALIARADEVVE